MKLISLIGAKGSGKSEAAKYITSYGYERTRFADSLKGMLNFLLEYQGVDLPTRLNMLDGNLKEVPTEYFGGRTPRHAMQTLGTEWRDMVSKTLYSDIWFRSVRNKQFVVVDDNRFVHEYERIRELGGIVIHIHRPGCEPGEHLSEKEFMQIPINFIIENDSTIFELYNNIYTTMNKAGLLS